MHQKSFFLAIMVALAFSSNLLAQSTPSSAGSSLARSSLAAASAAVTTGSPDPGTQAMVRNRARVLGDHISASGVRYWSLTDSDLQGKTPDQVLQRLSPTAINAGGRVREIDIVVNLRQPLTVFAKPGQSIDIGTADVKSAGLHSITVTSIISTAGLTVISK